MKKSASKILFFSAIALMLALPLVSAAIWGGWDSGFLGQTLKLMGMENVATGQQLLVFFAVFIIMVTASADLISTFSTFSTSTSWVIGIGLGIIMNASGVTSWLALVLFSIVATWGAIAIAAVIFSAFLAAFAVHLGISGLSGWLQRRKLMMTAEVGAAKAVAAIRGLKGIEAELAK
jgi:hypothetical protein